MTAVPLPPSTSAALVCGVPAGSGGLGAFAASALRALARAFERVEVLGPPPSDRALLELPGVRWHFPLPDPLARWWQRTPYRWLTGSYQLRADRRLGTWAAKRLDELRPSLLYTFTQVGLEPLTWAKAARVPSVLDNPNGHIEGFREVYVRESARWARRPHLGHPTRAAVRRIEAEYGLADRIRCSSHWAADSMRSRGIDAEKLAVLDQPISLERFRPATSRLPAEGPLRLCFVGSLDLRKGFPYLLEAMRIVGPDRVSLRIVGATGDRLSRRVFGALRRGLAVEAEPGDPVPAYQSAELFVLPSLEDGFGLVVAEAMASGLPVLATEACGAAEWVTPGTMGWRVPAGDARALADAVEDALRRRATLPEMGAMARREIERRAALDPTGRLADWLRSTSQLRTPPS